jgi:hypothetical protein
MIKKIHKQKDKITENLKRKTPKLISGKRSPKLSRCKKTISNLEGKSFESKKNHDGTQLKLKLVYRTR